MHSPPRIQFAAADGRSRLVRLFVLCLTAAALLLLAVPAEAGGRHKHKHKHGHHHHQYHYSYYDDYERYDDDVVVIVKPRPVYAPPPVVHYHPPPVYAPPLLNVVIPLDFD